MTASEFAMFSGIETNGPVANMVAMGIECSPFMRIDC